VIRLIGGSAVELDLPKAWTRIHNVFHVSLVKKYRPGPGAPPCLPLQPLRWLDGEPLYEIEQLLGHHFESRRGGGKGRKNRLEFLIRWRGYSSENDTWEPRENLLTCNEMIRDYKYARSLEITAFDEEDDGPSTP